MNKNILCRTAITSILLLSSVVSAQDLSQWRPKIWHQLVGQLKVQNNTTSTLEVTIWHPDTKTPFGKYSVAPNSNIPVGPPNIGDDWGVQIGAGSVRNAYDVSSWNGSAFNMTYGSAPAVASSGGVVEGGNREKLGNWKGAKGNAKFYRDGTTIITAEAWSDHKTEGLRANAFAVVSDAQGRALFVTPDFEFPTLGGKWDPTTPSAVTKTFTYKMPGEIGPLVKRIDLFFTTRDHNFWRSRVGSINSAVKAYNDLDPTVKSAIEAGLAALIAL